MELKEQALQYREEHFRNGETIINGSELFDQTESYDEWLAEVNRNTALEKVNKDWKRYIFLLKRPIQHPLK